MATTTDKNAQTGGLQIGKHLQLSKAQTTTFVAAAIAVFVVVFTIVAAKSLIGQGSFQRKVISAKHTALNQLQTNQQNVGKLTNAYQSFASTPQNMLGGTPDGSGPKDGSNARLVLQALPTQYDFPALASSIEKLITGQNMSIQTINGDDDQVNQQSNDASADPKPAEMPFSASAQGSYKQAQSLIGQFQSSIRPFQIQTLDLKGDQNNMAVTITAQTYYQPSKNFEVRHKVIK